MVETSSECKPRTKAADVDVDVDAAMPRVGRPLAPGAGLFPGAGWGVAVCLLVLLVYV